MSNVSADQLYIAIRSGMAALTTALNGNYKMLQALSLSGVISPEAAAALWAEMQDDARRAVKSSPPLAEAVEQLLDQLHPTFPS